MEETIRALRRELRILKILVVFSFLLSLATLAGLVRLARMSMDASWQAIDMFQDLSNDQQSLRRDVERDRRGRNEE